MTKLLLQLSLLIIAPCLSYAQEINLSGAQQIEFNKLKISILPLYQKPHSKSWDAFQSGNLLTEVEFYETIGEHNLASMAIEQKSKSGKFLAYGGLMLVGGALVAIFGFPEKTADIKAGDYLFIGGLISSVIGLGLISNGISKYTKKSANFAMANNKAIEYNKALILRIKGSF